MAFVRKDLTRLLPAMAASGSRHASVWYYATTDTDTNGAGYYDAAWQDVQKGDVIISVANISATPVLRLQVVTAVSTNSVTVANITTT